MRKRLLLAAGVLAAVAVVAVGISLIQRARLAPNLMSVARQSAADRDYATATAMYEEYLKLRPRDTDALSELAGVYDESARAALAKPREAAALWERSTTTYLTALALDPTRHEDRRKLAKLYIGMGQYADGKKQAEILAKEPSLKSDPEVYELLAACEGRNFDAAAKHLRAALDTGKAEVNTYLRLAHLLKFQINTPATHAEADDVMRRLVDKDHKDDLKARLARARYYADTKRRAEAKADIRYAYERIPGGKDNIDVVLAHADTVAADSLPEARDVLAAGLKAHPAHPQLLLGLAEVETRAGKRAEAARVLGELIGKLEDSDPLLLEAADRLLDLGDTAQAATLAKRMTASPLAAVSEYLDGRVKLIAGDWPAALPLLTRAVQSIDANRTLPRKPSLLLRAHLGVASCYALANDPERQSEACLKAVAADGSNIPARLLLADAFLKLDRTEDALNVLHGIAPYSAAAQVTIARLKLADAFRQPAAFDRRFDGFWDTVGRAGPYSPEVAHLVADAHVQQGQAGKATQVLETAIKEKPSAQLYISLAAVKGAGGAEPALAVLAEADKALGPNADLRLARAVVMLRDPKGDAKAVAALADGDKFDPAERVKLKTGLGELLLAAGKGVEGVPLLQEAAKERPFDLTVRLVLFDWAISSGDAALREQMLKDLRGIDGDDGAIAVAAQTTAELKGEKKLTAERNRELTAKLKEARTKRAAWGRLPYLLGVLAREDGRSDEALDLFETAISKGERSEPLVREVVQLLVQRDRYPQAMRLLGGLKASGKLSPELDRQYRLLEAVASNDPAKAVAWVRTPEAAASKNYQDHLLRGLVLAQFGETDEAQQAFILAGKLAPAAAEVYVTRVRVMVAAGIPTEKLKPVVTTAAEKLAEAKPANPATVPLALGRMYELIGEPKLAAEQFQKARAATPADVEPARLLHDLFTRTDPAAAARLLDELIAVGRSDLARWARRTRALAVADLPNPHKQLPQAVKLIDDNLADGQLTDDVRAKALVLARDPFQRQKALRDLQDSLARGPLTPDQSYRIALLRYQSGDASGAEQVLANATRSGLLANPLHLEFLLRLQLLRNDTTGAKATLDRLKVLAPSQPITVVSEARLIAKSDKDEDKARAAKLVLALPSTDPYRRVVTVGPLLEALDCLKEAEELYIEFSKGSTDPKTAHVPLAEFLARRGRIDDAVKLALDKHLAVPNIPPTTTARLLVAAVRSAPEQRDAGQKAEQFISAAVEAEPKNAELLVALADVQDARKQHKQAVNTYKRALDADPKGLRPVILNNLSGLRALLDHDGSDEVLGLVNDAISELGPEPYLLDTRATVRAASGNDLKAVEDLEAAFAVNPSPVYQFHLAQCHERMKAPADRDRAVAAAKKLGLKKAMLHPLEWSEFERVMR